MSEGIQPKNQSNSNHAEEINSSNDVNKAAVDKSVNSVNASDKPKKSSSKAKAKPIKADKAEKKSKDGKEANKTKAAKAKASKANKDIKPVKKPARIKKVNVADGDAKKMTKHIKNMQSALLKRNEADFVEAKPESAAERANRMIQERKKAAKEAPEEKKGISYMDLVSAVDNLKESMEEDEKMNDSDGASGMRGMSDMEDMGDDLKDPSDESASAKNNTEKKALKGKAAKNADKKSASSMYKDLQDQIESGAIASAPEENVAETSKNRDGILHHLSVLIKESKRRRYVSYQEIAEALPKNLSIDDLEHAISIFSDLDIDICKWRPSKGLHEKHWKNRIAKQRRRN